MAWGTVSEKEMVTVLATVSAQVSEKVMVTVSAQVLVTVSAKVSHSHLRSNRVCLSWPPFPRDHWFPKSMFLRCYYNRIDNYDLPHRQHSLHV